MMAKRKPMKKTLEQLTAEAAAINARGETLPLELREQIDEAARNAVS